MDSRQFPPVKTSVMYDLAFNSTSQAYEVVGQAQSAPNFDGSKTNKRDSEPITGFKAVDHILSSILSSEGANNGGVNIDGEKFSYSVNFIRVPFGGNR